MRVRCENGRIQVLEHREIIQDDDAPTVGAENECIASSGDLDVIHGYRWQTPRHTHPLLTTVQGHK
jgi:hypothetical protein